MLHALEGFLVLSLLFLPQGAGAAQHAAGAEQLVAVGRRDGTVSFLDRRVPGGWLRAVGGAGAGGGARSAAVLLA